MYSKAGCVCVFGKWEGHRLDGSDRCSRSGSHDFKNLLWRAESFGVNACQIQARKNVTYFVQPALRNVVSFRLEACSLSASKTDLVAREIAEQEYLHPCGLLWAPHHIRK